MNATSALRSPSCQALFTDGAKIIKVANENGLSVSLRQLHEMCFKLRWRKNKQKVPLLGSKDFFFTSPDFSTKIFADVDSEEHSSFVDEIKTRKLLL